MTPLPVWSPLLLGVLVKVLADFTPRLFRKCSRIPTIFKRRKSFFLRGGHHFIHDDKGFLAEIFGFQRSSALHPHILQTGSLPPRVTGCNRRKLVPRDQGRGSRWPFLRLL
ncbi:hypothetical protein B0H17DRAFT_525803 [Mycena rosella]|uniref:Secreted protein n=1 Tax=Mycena rosella TaxID=1033263 RepID=A0AAD7GXU0_MYCRO|nr:hypothetical protein B0H17DRAFT_525803 [Mycena rosella]